MIVLLQELEIQAVSNFPSQNSLKLGQSALLSVGGFLTSKIFLDFSLELLVLIVYNVESNLIGHKVVFGGEESAKEDCSGVWSAQEELALANLEVVEVASLSSLVYT